MQPMLKEMFQRLRRHIVLAHAKDVKASPDGTELPASGNSVLDYPLYQRLLAELDRPLDLILVAHDIETTEEREERNVYSRTTNDFIPGSGLGTQCGVDNESCSRKSAGKKHPGTKYRRCAFTARAHSGGGLALGWMVQLDRNRPRQPSGRDSAGT